MATDAIRPLRADAERNRRRILDAAASLFACRGLDVSMEEIAGEAGVGVGTLYRRFTDREALVDALFEEKIGEIVAIAHEALEVEDPWQAMSGFIRAAARKQAMDRGLREALLSSSRGRERVARGRDTIRPVAGEILRRAQAAGVARRDLDPFDIPMLQKALGFVADATREASPDYFERLLTIFLDGLRSEGASTMPASPLTPEQFEQSMAGHR